MIKKIRCIYCKSGTSISYRTIYSKHKNGVIILNEAPMFYCPKCQDTILPLEILDTFGYLKTLPLDPGKTIYEFKDIYKQVKTKKAR